MGGVRSVEQLTLDVLDHTERELLVTGYSLRASAARFWDHLANRLRAGVVCRMAVNNVGGQPSDVQRLLHGFGREFGEGFALYDFPPSDDRLAGLHAKVIVADRSVALVGSANLTFHGMAMAHELAVRLRGAAAAEVAYRVDDLLGSRVIRRYSG
jgi:phosphatidylserine/phosphatidylglycerophosphate/cardiolipin synthase-like enzyme